MKRGRLGAIVRLYGFKGVFELRELPERSRRWAAAYDWHAARPGEPESRGFAAHDASIVEIDGEPCPLKSYPLDFPAEDYPHVPQFERNPQEGIDAERYARMAERMTAHWCKHYFVHMV